MGKVSAIAIAACVLVAASVGVAAWTLGWFGSTAATLSTQSPDVQRVVDMLRRADGRSIGYLTEIEVARILGKTEAPYSEVKRLLSAGDRDGAVAVLIKQRARTSDARLDAALSRDIGALELPGHAEAAHAAYSRARLSDKDATIDYQLAVLDLRRGKKVSNTVPLEKIAERSDAEAVVRAHALSMIAIQLASNAQFGHALESVREAVEEADRSGDPVVVANAKSQCALILSFAGKVDDAVVLGKSALVAAEQSGREESVAMAKWVLSQVYLTARRPDDASLAAQQAIADLEKLGLRQEAGTGHAMLARIAEQAGDYGLARREMTTAIGRVSSDAPQALYGLLATLARIEMKAGNLDIAEQTLTNAETICLQTEVQVCEMVIGPIRQRLADALAARH